MDAPHRTRNRLKIRQMLLLVALDDTGSLNQAAEATHMTQPAASKMLKDVEALFGVPLFERLPRGMRPTLYGTTLVAHVRMALANLAQGQESIAALRAGLAGEVHFGTIVTPSMTVIPQAIAETKALAPRLTIGVTVGTSNELLGRLRHGELDFLVARIQAPEDGAGLVYENLSEETECAVVRSGHPFLQRLDLSLQALSQASWILSPRGTILRHRFDMVFRRHDLEPPTHVVETTAMTVIQSLLQQTDALHVMPEEVARHWVAAGELAILPFDLRCEMESFGLVTQRDRLLSPGASLMLQQLRQVAARVYRSPR